MSTTWDPQTGLLSDVALGDVATSLGRNGLGDVTQTVTSHAGAEVLRVKYARDAVRRVGIRAETRAGQQPERRCYEYDAVGRWSGAVAGGGGWIVWPWLSWLPSRRRSRGRIERWHV